jgi:hypothetical protein
MSNLSSDEIRKILKDEWPDLKHVWLFDPIYTVASRGAIASLIEPVEQEFDKKFDCDKFAMVTHAQVSLAVASDMRFEYCVTFGQIAYKHSVSGECHMVNLLLTPEINVYEPQGGFYTNGKNMNPYYVRM